MSTLTLPVADWDSCYVNVYLIDSFASKSNPIAVILLVFMLSYAFLYDIMAYYVSGSRLQQPVTLLICIPFVTLYTARLQISWYK